MLTPFLEFCALNCISTPFTVRHVRKGKGPEVIAVGGKLFVDTEAEKTLLFLMSAPKEVTSPNGKKTKIKKQMGTAHAPLYDVSNNDSCTEEDALDAFDNYAKFVGFANARRLLKARFGVTRIGNLDSEHQRIAAKIFDYHAENKLTG